MKNVYFSLGKVVKIKADMNNGDFIIVDALTHRRVRIHWVQLLLNTTCGLRHYEECISALLRLVDRNPVTSKVKITKDADVLIDKIIETSHQLY